MATDTRTYDVWLTDHNKVYKGVPFTVVGDWIQEGRLLESDRVRPNGGTTWQRLAEDQLLAPYLPKKEVAHEDQAEALERLDVDFNVKRHPEAEDDDVDMIPLIDISMVLLVFFMMTASELLTATPVKTPKAATAAAVSPRRALSVGLKMDEATGKRVEYYFDDNYVEILDEFQFIQKIRERLNAPTNRPERVVVNAAGNVAFDKVQQVTLDLEKLGANLIQGKVTHTGGAGKPEGTP